MSRKEVIKKHTQNKTNESIYYGSVQLHYCQQILNDTDGKNLVLTNTGRTYLICFKFVKSYVYDVTAVCIFLFFDIKNPHKITTIFN